MATIDTKTSRDLLEKLGASAKQKLTKEEIDKQRVSFIFSGMPKESGMSKIDIENALSKAS